MSEPDPTEICEGPPDAPFATSVWAHAWMPLSLLDLPGVQDPELREGSVRVLEVCPSCRRWRVVPYGKAPTPENGG